MMKTSINYQTIYVWVLPLNHVYLFSGADLEVLKGGQIFKKKLHILSTFFLVDQFDFLRSTKLL